MEPSIQATIASTPSAQSHTAINVGTANGELASHVTMETLLTLMDVITTVPLILAGHVILGSDYLRPRIISQPLSAISVVIANGRQESNVIMGTRRDVTLVVRSCLLMSVIQGSI